MHLNDEDVKVNLFETGWSRTTSQHNLGRQRTNDLLKAELDTMPHEACNSTYRFLNWTVHLPTLHDNISRGLYCTMNSDQIADRCQSNSGGPLQYFGDATSRAATVVGIVSVGFGCGSSLPGIYTRVAYYLDWIESIVWPAEG